VTSLIRFRKTQKFPDERLSQSAVEIVNKIENLVLKVFSRSAEVFINKRDDVAKHSMTVSKLLCQLPENI
jgi:23S rRNA maturation-related 3'-5' exoribonuclease YhaM